MGSLRKGVDYEGIRIDYPSERTKGERNKGSASLDILYERDKLKGG